MKVTLFHLMPYRALPEDFEQRHESVFVTIPNDLADPRLVHQYYNESLDEMELAASLGFDGLGVNEHHQNAYGFMCSPNVMAGALARRTTGCAIVVLGATLGLYQPALRVAEEYAVVDCMSGGRLVAGMPVGTSADVNFSYGIAPLETRPRFAEAHDLILQAWTRSGPFPFNGRFNQLRYVNPWPKPLQQPHPPIWLTGTGSPETVEMACRRGYAYNYLSYFGMDNAAATLQRFWETVDQLGSDRNPHRLGFLQLVCVSETDAQAERDYLEHVAYLYRKLLHVPPHFQAAPGYVTKRALMHLLSGQQLGDPAKVASLEADWKTYVNEGFVIGGSPATVRDRLRETCERLRIGHLMLLLQIGSMPHHLAEKNITLFASEVLPHLRDMWEPEWPDRWWPAALGGTRESASVPGIAGDER